MKNAENVSINSVYDAVVSILSSHYLLRDAVDLEIVNYSSLARKILPWVESLVGKKVSDESVLMALVRYSKKTKKRTTWNSDLTEVIASCTLAVFDDAVDVVLPRSSETFHALNALSSKVNWNKNELLYVTQASGEIAVVLDSRNFAKLTKSLSKSAFVDVQKNLSVIRIRFNSEKFISTPGPVSVFLRILALHSLNVIELATAYNEVSIVVPDSLLTRVYDLFKEEITKAKNLMEQSSIK